MRHEILGIPVDGVTKKEALARVARFLREPRGHFVTTPNPEMLVLAQEDEAFGRALLHADLAIPDGIGLVWAARMRGFRMPERVTGADFVDDIVRLAAERGKPVFFLGGAEGIADAAARALAKRHHGLRIAGSMSGGAVRRSESGGWRTEEDAIPAITASRAEILFVAFGHEKQEEWIVEHLGQLPSVRIAMGVGGAFDFIAGRQRRAPKLLHRLGLEWLWRLMREPCRLKRIWTAVIVFPLLVLRQKN